MFQILIATDDQSMGELACEALNKDNYTTYVASNVDEILSVLNQTQVDLIIEDGQFFDCDKYSLINNLRGSGYQFPFLIITKQGTYPDKAKGFKPGVDDYMSKPIDTNELLIRVEGLLCRSKIIYERKLEFGSVCLDYINLTVTIDGRAQILPQKEFQLLFKLLSSPNHTFTRQQIMDELWGFDSKTDPRTVDVHINRLRDKYKDNPYFQIQTMRGIGYKGVIAK